MEKRTAVSEARRGFDTLIRDAELEGDKYVIEQDGEPLPVTVPLRVYEDWKHERNLMIEAMLDVQKSSLQHTPGTSDAEIMEMAVEAVREVRAQMRAEREAARQK